MTEGLPCEGRKKEGSEESRGSQEKIFDKFEEREKK